MKLIIAGGRDFFPEFDDFEFLETLHKNEKITEVVSGCAKGADSFGELWAEENNIPVKKFPADWKKYGRGAGHRRNKQMADYGEALLAYWDGASSGTKSMIEYAKERGLKVYVKKYKKT